MNETITATEVFTGFWILFLTSFRGFLLIATGILHTMARIIFTVTLKMVAGASMAHRYIQDWQPIIPALFDVREIKCQR